MSLLNHLRPKWQNSDPDVRAEAVAGTDKAEVELLTAVAREDPDPKVRRIAVKKLERPRLLLEIAESDDDANVAGFARERARSLLVRIASDERDLEESQRALALLTDGADIASVAEKAKFPEVRRAAFDALPDDDALAEFVRHSRDPDLRIRALERIQAPAALKSVILDDTSGDLAQAALGRLDDLPTLESVVAQHRLNRALRRAAHARLLSLAPMDHPARVAERAERYAELCSQAEALERDFPEDAEEGLDALVRAWEELATEGPSEAATRERFERTCASVRELKARRERKRRKRLDVSAETDTHATSTEPAPLEPAETEALAADTEAPSETEDDDASRDAHRTIEDLLERAEKAAALEDVEEASKTMRALAEPWKAAKNAASRDAVERFQSLRDGVKNRVQEARKAHEAEAQARTLEELERRTERLVALAAQEEVLIKEAERELKEAQDFLKAMGPLPANANRKKLRRQLADARQALFRKTQETRDNQEWKRWANSDIQEALIKRVEALKESKDIPKIAKELRLVQDEWKRAGSAVPEKAEELWQRYRAVRNELKARCDAFFKEQKKERASNLELKLALCEKVEALKDSTDWRETAEAIKTIQADWKSIGPVPNEDSEAVWKRFRAACDHFFARRNDDLDRLKSERAENLSKKQALCERAEAIKDSTSWNEAANELKALQAEWRAIGPVPRNKSEALWERFRSACDYFFDRNKRRDEVELEERQRALDSLVEELEGLEAGAEGAEGAEGASESAKKTLDLWSRWRQLGGSSQANAEAARRFEQRIAEIVASAPEAFRETELDPAQTEARRRKIVEQLEGMVQNKGDGVGEDDALEDLAARLKDALASNTMTGGKGRDEHRERRAEADAIRRLKSSWQRAAPLGGEVGRALAARFDAAYASFRERERAHEPGA